MDDVNLWSGQRRSSSARRFPAVWGALFWIGVMLMVQPLNTQAVAQQNPELQIQHLAFQIGQQVWHNLGLPGLFNNGSVIIAYYNLSNSPMFTPADDTPQNRTHTFLEPGLFFHLVQQSVMVNAALDNVNNGPFLLTAAQLFAASDPVYRAPGTQVALHNLIQSYGSVPHDPNIMAGPVACIADRLSLNLPVRRGSRMAACLGGHGVPYLALPPYTYTISFYNNGAAAADPVTVVDYIDPATQHGLTLGDLTWGGQTTYPTMVWSPQTGVVPIRAGQLAPVPAPGDTWHYLCSNGLTFTLKCMLVQGLLEYIWTFNNPHMPLNINESGSLSFYVEPNALPAGNNINNPAAYDAANGGPLNGVQVNNAFVIFNIAMATNVWQRLY